MILAGDIGGTKTNLTYFRAEGDRLTSVLSQSYPSQQYASLEEILRVFRAEHPAPIEAAAFGIAGPVVDNRCRLTNLKWEIDAAALREELGLRGVRLLNDLEALAYGTLRLEPSEKVMLQQGEARAHGAIAVVAAGTGLGEGALAWNGIHYQALPSEGGHADFSPRNDLEIDLLKFMLGRHEHVSWERLLSGPGISAIYEFLRARSGQKEPSWLTDARRAGDPSAAVSQAGVEGKDPVCVETLALFVSLYGSEAGNAALKFLGTGGVFIGGGIAPKILAVMTGGKFLASFLDKGRFRELLSRIPVAVVLNDKIALTGSAHVGLMLARG